jgi:hypothetical protein
MEYAIRTLCAGYGDVRLSSGDRGVILGAERDGLSFITDRTERYAWFVTILSLAGGDVALGVATIAKAPMSAAEILALPAIHAVLDTVVIDFCRPAT